MTGRMSARHVIISPEALVDLEAIWAYIANEAGAQTAGTVVADVLDAIDKLADMPGWDTAARTCATPGTASGLSSRT